MAESLKDVIAKLKQNSQQQAKAIKQEIPALVKKEIQVPAELEDGTDEDEMDEEMAQEIQAKKDNAVDPKEQERVAQILEEIEMLQNNGRFRAELLHQLQEINQALVVIASAIASKNDKA